MEPNPTLEPAKTVLVVDDDDDVQRILPEALTGAGYRVMQARNGVVGLELARNGQPNLIIMDADMPVLGGGDAARLLKRDPQTAAIPVLAFTASSVAASLRQELLDLSDGVLPKPSTPTEVLEVVERWIGPARGPAPGGGESSIHS